MLFSHEVHHFFGLALLEFGAKLLLSFEILDGSFVDFLELLSFSVDFSFDFFISHAILDEFELNRSRLTFQCLRLWLLLGLFFFLLGFRVILAFFLFRQLLRFIHGYFCLFTCGKKRGHVDRFATGEGSLDLLRISINFLLSNCVPVFVLIVD